MSSDFIRFDPEKIQGVATELETNNKSFTEGITEIKQISNNLCSDWKGESSTKYLEKLHRLYDEGDELGTILTELTQDLMEISGVYKTGESQAKKQAEALPTEGVFLV